MVEHSGSPPSGLMQALAWLAHPVTLAATALLLLNDHVLKAAYPGWVTGKLSDLAGLIMAPPLVAVLLAVSVPWLRPGAVRVAGVVAVGVGFAAVKAIGPVAVWASGLWSVLNGPSVVLADRSDLLALPALGVAWWIARRAPADLAQWAQLAAVLVVLPTAALAVAATSPPQYEHAGGLGEWRSRVLLMEPTGYVSGVSMDEGLTFPYPDEATSRELNDTGARIVSAGPIDCSAVELGHCFRVVPGHLRVEETDDGGTVWRVAWQLTEAERDRLLTRTPAVRDVNEDLSSLAVLVRDLPGGGVVVLVANGRDGLARRDLGGAWHRIGFAHGGTRGQARTIPGADPITVFRSSPLTTVLALVVFGLVILVGGAVAGQDRNGINPAVVGAPTVVIGALFALWGQGTDEGVEDLLPFGLGVVILGGLVLLTGAAITLFLASRTMALWRWLLAVAATASIAILGLAIGPITVGWPAPSYEGLLTAIVTVTSIALGGVLGSRRRAPATPDPVPSPAP